MTKNTVMRYKVTLKTAIVLHHLSLNILLFLNTQRFVMRLSFNIKFWDF